MCRWCDEYGGGHERWYLNPANYARRLYKIRKEESESKGAEANPQQPGGMSLVGSNMMDALDRGDDVEANRLRREAEEHAFKVHFGQVVTPAEVEQMMDIMWPMAIMTCACRRSMYDEPNEENFSCMGMGVGMYKWERWPDTYRGGVQFLSVEEAKETAKTLVKKGLVPCVYAFGTPYLGGLCWCDYPNCGGIRNTLDYGIHFLWKGHYVAEIDNDLCNGCAQCARRCQFKALNFAPTDNKAYIDPMKCFGCGLCETVCKPKAIKLVERTSRLALADKW